MRTLFHRLLALPLVLLFLGALPAEAQEFSAELFTRVADGKVQAALKVSVAPGYHLYHTELGDPRATGKPTTVTFEGEGVTWGEVVFPEPHAFEEISFEPGPPPMALAHEGTFVLRAEGRLSGGDGSGITATLDGLICDDRGCIPVGDTYASKGAGSDELFAASEKVAAPAAPAADTQVSGRADATLYTRVEDRKVRAAIELEIEPGWHLYHTDLGHPEFTFGKPIRVDLHGEGVRWGPLFTPEPHKHDEGMEASDGSPLWSAVHEGTVVFYAEGDLADSAADDVAIWAELRGQTCKDVCLEYEETAVSRGAGPDAVWADMEAVVQAATSGPSGEEEDDEGLLAFLALAVGWGLFTLLMPCTYPMIPITISFFTKQAESRGGKVLPLSLAYGAGIVGIFILIGVVFGSVIIPFATHWVTNLVIGAAFLYFSFVLFGVIQLNPPRALMNLAGKASSTGGYLGVFLMGATLVITSFTCTAPFVGNLLSVGASDGNLGRIVIGMGAFGLTMAVPFVFLSLVPGKLRSMPQSGEWMNTLKFTLGFVELAAALKFISNADLVLHWEVLPRGTFLVIWGVVFLAAGLYLFGFLARNARPGTGRRVAATGLSAFALYCFWGVGNPMDSVMEALVPPYPEVVTWAKVDDDYEGARKRARGEDKLLLVNFTGHT